MFPAGPVLLDHLFSANLKSTRESPNLTGVEPRHDKGKLVAMPLSERIVVDSGILAGKPVIRGTRLTVAFILELLAAGQSESELLMNYPGLTRDDILACLSYASYLAHEYKAYPISA